MSWKSTTLMTQRSCITECSELHNGMSCVTESGKRYRICAHNYWDVTIDSRKSSSTIIERWRSQRERRRLIAKADFSQWLLKAQGTRKWIKVDSFASPLIAFFLNWRLQSSLSNIIIWLNKKDYCRASTGIHFYCR